MMRRRDSEPLSFAAVYVTVGRYPGGVVFDVLVQDVRRFQRMQTPAHPPVPQHVYWQFPAGSKWTCSLMAAGAVMPVWEWELTEELLAAAFKSKGERGAEGS